MAKVLEHLPLKYETLVPTSTIKMKKIGRESWSTLYTVINVGTQEE
jgi:hypothetical protein